MALRPWRGCRSARFTVPFALVATPIRHSGFVLCSILCCKLALRAVLRSSASDCSGLCRERRWGHRWRRDHILVFAVRASGRRTFSKGTGGTSDLPESSRSRNHHCDSLRRRMVQHGSTAAYLVADVAAAESRWRNRGISCRIGFHPARCDHRLYPWFLLDPTASPKLTGAHATRRTTVPVSVKSV